MSDYQYSPDRANMSFNFTGVATLLGKEVRRFIKVWMQTVMAPVVTTLLFMAIFALALGGALKEIHGVSFLVFIAPGLIMMSMVQNAFANSSSSLMISKIQGNIVDVLMPPFSSFELVFCFAVGGVIRGVLVGLVTGIVMAFFVDIPIHNLAAIVFFTVSASLMLSLLGLIGGVWAEKFDHLAAVTNFVISPLSFLSGTFYSIDRLPEFWQGVIMFNPFFYMIDGFRYGFIGRADGNILTGIVFLTVINILLWTAAHIMLSRGRQLKP